MQSTTSVPRKGDKVRIVGTKTSGPSATSSETSNHKRSPGHRAERFSKTLSAILSGETVTPLEALLEPIDPVDSNWEIVIGRINDPITRQLFSYYRRLAHRARSVPPLQNLTDMERYNQEVGFLVSQANTAFDVMAQRMIAELPGAYPLSKSIVTALRAEWLVVQLKEKRSTSPVSLMDVLYGGSLRNRDYDGDDGTGMPNSHAVQ